MIVVHGYVSNVKDRQGRVSGMGVVDFVDFRVSPEPGEWGVSASVVAMRLPKGGLADGQLVKFSARPEALVTKTGKAFAVMIVEAWLDA